VRGVALGIIPTRLLGDGLPGPEERPLPCDLVLDGLFNEAEGVHVLDLHPSAELLRSRRSEADVGVAAEIAFLHVAVTDSDRGDDRMDRSQIRAGLRSRPQIRL